MSNHPGEAREAVQLAWRHVDVSSERGGVEISDTSALPEPEGSVLEAISSSRRSSHTPSARRAGRALEAADSRTAQAPSARRRTAGSRSAARTEPGPPRQRARVVTSPLPAAFPPPPRGEVATGDGDEGSSTSSSRTSPEINRSRVSSSALDVANELELSVPSHQEHLTADGQR